LTLPKGGGAIRGMGEKFGVNPVTGTGSLSVPLYTSPGRSGFGPQLSLGYDSGSGNGPFGFGWSLAIPAITRKTDKGLPQYVDAEESDVFLLSGAEDLMPALVQVKGAWNRDVSTRTVYGKLYTIHRYRPRVEGLFARIERWINTADPTDAFWRSITKDNVTTWYGKTSESRIADPADSTRIFSWLICESSDDKGNVISYQYKPEDATGVDLSQAQERNRTRTAKRYLKHVFYGNRTPYFPDLTQPAPAPLPTDWCFQVVFDFGEHDLNNPTPQDPGSWICRPDPFSTYRSTFEVRTYRLCQRVLMFHHFEHETNIGLNCLVRSSTLAYSAPPADPSQPVYSFLLSVTQTGHTRSSPTTYTASSLPPLEFDYTEAVIDETVREVDPTSLENLPYGLDGSHYRWADLDGEGLKGILTEQGGSWFYKANLSPVNQQTVNGARLTLPQFAPVEVVGRQPSLAALNAGRQQLLDLSGDGQLDLVDFDRPTPGFFERTQHASWKPFKVFESLPNLDWRNPNLRFIDLTGDGLPDLLIADDDVFCWHASLGAEGFDVEQRVKQALDEEKGPKLLFSDGTESIFLADMSGDGLTDLVRIRNGEVCYWPNIGYGRFGTKIAMDQAPRFDRPELFHGRRILLADIDGSGTSDIIYFASGGVDVYFNQSGNSFGVRRTLNQFPAVENVSSATALDLLGNGTACLVWSSPLASNIRRPMRYIDLMGGQKPHLLIQVTNNLGAETVVQYAPSTKFYVADKIAGTPWVTRLPFPVQVVEQAQTYDFVSRNLFITRYSYHHGYFDGVEREFRGFGRVDQFDTAQFATLTDSGDFPQPVNVDASSNVPPVCTKTWFHTGAFFGEKRISKYLEHEYYSEGDAAEGIAGLTLPQLEAMLLDDTVLPTTILLPDGSRIAYDLSGEEMREACRALRGSILRQEIYAEDDTEASDRPYSVSELNYTIETLQPQGPNQFGVFFAHPRETIDFHYERKLYKIGTQTVADPRVTHSAVLAADPFGNVLESVSIGYGRRHADPSLAAPDQSKQSNLLGTYVDNSYTNAVLLDDSYRTPLAAQASSYELLQIKPLANQAGFTNLFRFDELQTTIQSAADGAHDIPFEDLNPVGLNAGEPYRRLIASTRTFYRPDDMGAAAADPRALLPLGQLQSLALSGISYRLAFTKGLLTQVYQRGGAALLPAPAAVLASVAADGGAYVDLDSNGNFWIPSGRVFFLDTAPSSPQESNQALDNFFLPRRFEDPFGSATVVDYEAPHNLLPKQATDAIGNVISATNNYRVLGPTLLTDPNLDQTAAAYDSLGLVVATAVMGKTTETLGDQLTGFSPDLTLAQINPFYDAADPRTLAAPLLGNASTRVVYDVNRFFNTRKAAPNDPSQWLPAFAATTARETHVSDLGPGQQSKLQISFCYSDGFGREIQKKIQSEPGPVVDGGPVMNPRWVGSGWTIFNNKGQPVRQFEPFFSQLPKGHQFEFGNAVGVSPIICYDPLQRVVAKIHPNHTYEKVAFDPWTQTSFDLNDTVAEDDPTTDPDVGDFFQRLPAVDFSPTWRVQRAGGALGPLEQDAATKAAAHANTPSLEYADSLGRTFLTIADNGAAGQYSTRVELDIQNNQRSVTDALGRTVIVYDYSVLTQRIHQSSMEAGESWVLNAATGKTIRAFDSRGHNLRTEYDLLRRPLNLFVLGTDAVNSDARTTAAEVQFEKTVYGEGQPNDQALNLRTRVFQHFDAAGVVNNVVTDPVTAKNVAFDFKGNPLGNSRQFVQDYNALPDWSKPAPAFLPDVFVSTVQYDALNRVVAARSPDGSVTRPTYNEASLLESVGVNLLGAGATTAFVSNIDYNAKGQRVLIDYGALGAPFASTAYSYDPLTFRLVNSTTTRPGFPAAQQPAQNLSYTFDPVGNVTHILDSAQQTIYFNNRRVEPSGDYTYDALYRLTQAKGREQLGLDGANNPLPPFPSNYNDVPRIHLPHPGDGNAMGTYIENYVYDDVGNFVTLKHTRDSHLNAGWTRSYAYNEASLLEPAKVSNRLSSSSVSGSVIWNEPYTYDLHGNTTSMPQLQSMQWDFKDHLFMTQRQAVNAGDADGKLHQGERTYYVYNSDGERVRKTTESARGVKTKERFYLGVVEVYREYDGAGNTTLERQTLHVVDDKRRVALVETLTGGAGAFRFQFDNHLGTACLELDETGAVIAYEEYYPYGSTSYQAGRSAAETSLKRYRYTGKERDEETGLHYHGARYYASWLGRWTACDPSGVKDGPNSYLYVSNRPIIANDPNGKWLNILIGAVVGAVIGGGVELARQLIKGEKVDWGRVGAATVGGAVGGAIAGATFGASLAVEAAGVAVGAAVGGSVTRAINNEPTTPSAVAWDVGIALATFGILKGAGAAWGRFSGPATEGVEGGTGSAPRGSVKGTAQPKPAAAVGDQASVDARAAAGAIPPRPPIPTIPPQYKGLNDFGKAIGWGSKLTPEEARELARQTSLEQIKATGVTRNMLQALKDFHEYFAKYEPRNATAPGRVAFLDEILKRYFPVSGAAVPGAAAGAAAGSQPNDKPAGAPSPSSRASSGGSSSGKSSGATKPTFGMIPGLIYDQATGTTTSGWLRVLPDPQSGPANNDALHGLPNVPAAPTTPLLELRIPGT
jgi:RHS repeat-associated protein